MTAVPLIEPLGGFPEEWQAHEMYAWDAVAPETSNVGPYMAITVGPLRGWVTCSCGFESTPRDNPSIQPLLYAEAHNAYIAHLPPGMAAWLVKGRYDGPRTDSERVARVRTLVEQCHESGATSVSVELVKDALGWYR